MIHYLPVLGAGLYAWGTSVAPLFFDAGSVPAARIAALVALACLVGGGFVSERWRSSFGLYGFVGGCAVAWFFSPITEPSPFTLVGWILYALAWGAPLSKPAPSADDPGPPLLPRVPARRGTTLLVFGFGAAGVVLLVTALDIERSSGRLLALVVALGASLALLRASAAIASDYQIGPGEVRSSWWARAGAPLGFLILGGLAFLGWVTRASW